MQGKIQRRLMVAIIATPLFILTACQPTTKVVPEKTEVIRAWTPQWYSETERGEEGSIYKTAQAVGANQTVSENLAVNQARQEMALSIDARVDVLQRNFQEQIEAADDLNLLQRFQDVNTIVASKTLHGSHVVKKETYVEDDGNYRTFVLMELDGRDIDANMLNSLKEVEELETRLRSSEAWAELERRALELRQERTGAAPMTDKQITDGE